MYRMYHEHSRSLEKRGYRYGRPESMPVFMKEVGLQLSHEVGGQETEDSRSWEDI